MLKFLRRYNKAILMVGGSILMVLFLLPSTTNQIGQGMMSRAVAYMDGDKITVIDMHDAAREMALIDAVSPGLLQALGIEDKNSMHWMLMVREARLAGLIGGPKEARRDVREDVLMALRARATDAEIDRALSHTRGVIRLISTAMPASIYSTREAIMLGRRLLDTATISVATISADSVAATLPDPDEDRLQAHFEAFRNIDPKDDPHGIGYRRPKAVQIEWMTIDRMSVEAAFTPDPVEVNKFWRQNQSRFPGEFAAVREQVEKEYKKVQVDQAMNRAADAVKRELFRSTAGLPSDGPYKTLPADWASKMPQLQDLASLADAEIRRLFPTLTQGTSVGGGPGVWRSASDLARLPGIGFAYLMIGNTRLNFSEFAMQAREIGGVESLGVQKGMVHGPLQDFRGSLFYIRIIDAREAGPPDSLDEVRDAAVRNIKMLDAMERLKAEAEMYRERAIADGIEAMAGSSGVPVRTGVEVTQESVKGQFGMPDPALDDPGFREAVMTMARQLDPTAQIGSVDARERTIAMAFPKARGLVVAQITGWRPMTVERFRSSAAEIAALASRDQSSAEIIKAFSFERLRERHSLKIVDEGARRPRGDSNDQESPG